MTGDEPRSTPTGFLTTHGSFRLVPTDRLREENEETHCQEVRQVGPSPAWDRYPSGDYEFLCVDGGFMDNVSSLEERELMAAAP